MNKEGDVRHGIAPETGFVHTATFHHFNFNSNVSNNMATFEIIMPTTYSNRTIYILGIQDVQQVMIQIEQRHF